eukprot:5907753-Amphidinium_carterae.1
MSLGFGRGWQSRHAATFTLYKSLKHAKYIAAGPLQCSWKRNAPHTMLTMEGENHALVENNREGSRGAIGAHRERREQ